MESAGPAKPEKRSAISASSTAPRIQEEHTRKTSRGSRAERLPITAKTAQIEKSPASATHTAWTAANRTNSMKVPWAAAVTNKGNITTGMAFTATETTETAIRMAAAFASRIRRGFTGRGARFR